MIGQGLLTSRFLNGPSVDLSRDKKSVRFGGGTATSRA